MSKTKIRLLSAEQDREALAPVLEQLRARGVRVSETETGGRDEVTLAVLSEAFYADRTLTDALLSRLSAGAENVLPLKLDAAPVPPQLKKALYARNIIPAEERSPEQLAERIRSAIPEKKSRLPLLLTAGALVLAVVAGLLIWRAVQNRQTVPAMADVPAAAEIVLPAGLTEADLARVEDVVIVGDRIEFYTADDVRMIDAVTNGNAVRIPDWPQAEYFAYRSWEDDTAHFYSREDGHEYSLTRYDSIAITGTSAKDDSSYTQEELELIWAIVAQEDDQSYEGALAVISSAMNRADANYGGYGTTALAQLTADGQYCYSPKVSDPSLWQRRLGGNVPDDVKKAVEDCLTKGIRNNTYLNFRSSNRTGDYIQIGANWYF